LEPSDHGQEWSLGLDYHGQEYYHGHDNMPRLAQAGKWYVDQVAQLLRASGWKIISQPNVLGSADLLIRMGHLQYVVEVKRAAESRRDRIVPLLAEAILQAQAYAHKIPGAQPLAIIASPRLSQSVVNQGLAFQQEYALHVGVGFLDERGFRVFHGEGLEPLNSSPQEIEEKNSALGDHKPYPLFSDLGQWMLKVLLAQHIDPRFLNAPRLKIHNASALALAADVSQVSASRLVRELDAEGFLNQYRDQLELVRVPELLEEWQAAARRAYKDIPCRWVIPGRGKKEFEGALRAYRAGLLSQDSSEISRHRNPRVCLGLFAAAEALGLGFVHGVPPMLYVEHIVPQLIEQLGISKERSEQADLFLRIPEYKESVFRAAIEINGVPASDAVQVWLDVSKHPSRGKEQADHLREQVFGTLLKH
jgi:DNA-binding MarR family transcriptional regulator